MRRREERDKERGGGQPIWQFLKNLIYKISTRTQILSMHLKTKKETAFGQSSSVMQEVAALTNKKNEMLLFFERKNEMLLKDNIILCII